MEGKELRLGNYLHDRNGNLCKVIELRQDGIYAPAINEAITGLPNKPIELTEDWLLKFGFSKIRYTDKKLNYYSKGFVKCYIENSNIFFDVIQGCIQVKYVHQLQNLYFALTGEELTIKS
ncbi:hypothetical protein CMV02_02890 [Elizabethkingia anophelis]|nr:hypothetical protein [Elizabethkingia anophelis]